MADAIRQSHCGMTILLRLILITAALRIAWAAGIGLGIDESYMVVAGRGPLQLGYFDHPLISWWLSRGIADLTGSEAAVIVRLPFIALFAVSTWMMAKLAGGGRTGLWAAVAFNLAPVFGVTTGAWVLPDGPLIAALLGMALCLMRALPAQGWRWWIGAGMCAGLAMLSKYTAVLPMAGLGFYLLAFRRDWLARPQPYVAALLAALVFSPTIIWNARHGWASLAFQGGRATAAQWHPFGPLVTLGGEALFLLPWIWAGLIWAGWHYRRSHTLLVCMALPPIMLFVILSLWSRQILFHWASPGYLMLFPLLGAWLAECAWAPRAARATAALIGVALLLVVSEVRLGWLPLSGDPALQARDWAELRPALLPLGLPIAGTSWSDTGKIGIGMGPDVAVFCLNADAREFRFSTTPPRSGDVVIVAPRRSLSQMQQAYGANFSSIEAGPAVRVGATEMPTYIGRNLIAWPR
jgi:4-amino-4-deoxy-L-arabinose transferase-like glycosyltransferase